MDFKQIADKVLGMLQRADGNDPSRGHLTMNNWEWPTGVAICSTGKSSPTATSTPSRPC